VLGVAGLGVLGGAALCGLVLGVLGGACRPDC
jgi:hypothetical protein